MPRPEMRALIIEDEYVLALDMEDHLRPLGFTSFDMAATGAGDRSRSEAQA